MDQIVDAPFDFRNGEVQRCVDDALVSVLTSTVLMLITMTRRCDSGEAKEPLGILRAANVDEFDLIPTLH